jgi:hypothetical protein
VVLFADHCSAFSLSSQEQLGSASTPCVILSAVESFAVSVSLLSLVSSRTGKIKIFTATMFCENCECKLQLVWKSLFASLLFFFGKRDSGFPSLWRADFEYSEDGFSGSFKVQTKSKIEADPKFPSSTRFCTWQRNVNVQTMQRERTIEQLGFVRRVLETSGD